MTTIAAIDALVWAAVRKYRREAEITSDRNERETLLRRAEKLETVLLTTEQITGEPPQ